MKIHLVSFIGMSSRNDLGLGTAGEKEREFNRASWDEIEQRQKKLSKSALSNGEVDYVHEWTLEKLKKTKFYSENKTLLDQLKGCGYWAWKPYIILQALSKAEPGDYVIYCDVGRPVNAAEFDHGNIIQTSLRPLAEWAERHQGMLPGVYLPNHGAAQAWIKRDCFKVMNCDSENYWQTPTIQAGYSVWKNTERSREVLNEWLTLNCDPRLISDQENTLSAENFPGFIRHCHDQATLTLLCEKLGITVFGHKEHQFWGFRNINFISMEARVQNAHANGELVLNSLSGVENNLPRLLVRWIELLFLHRRFEQLNILIDDESSTGFWQTYFPNCKIIVGFSSTLNFDFIYLPSFHQKPCTEKEGEKAESLFSEGQDIKIKQFVKNFRMMNESGIMILGDLNLLGESQLEQFARAISESGKLPDEFGFKNNENLVKIPNSRNPVFLTSQNKRFMLTYKPESLIV